MAHHIHKTPGIVLHHAPSGEANSFLVIFTRELGRITITAQGSRFLKSKLRYGIQKYTVGQYSVVYGRFSWRLVGALPEYSLYYQQAPKPEVLKIISQTCGLLQRLLTGEEKNTELFDLVVSGFTFMSKNELSKQELKYFEFLFILRILSNLGYISGSGGLEDLAIGSEWNTEVLSNIASFRNEAVSAINRAILESQL